MKIALLVAGLQLLVICTAGAAGGFAASPGPEEAAVKRVKFLVRRCRRASVGRG